MRIGLGLILLMGGMLGVVLSAPSAGYVWFWMPGHTRMSPKLCVFMCSCISLLTCLVEFIS